MDESGTDEAESGRRVAGAIRSMVNNKGLQFKRVRVLHETLFVPVLMYRRETMIRKERFRITAAQIDNLGGLLGIRRMDKGVVRNEEGGRRKD